MITTTCNLIPKQRLSVVVPVYNGETTIVQLIARLDTVLRPITHGFEVILIDDVSRDRSWDVICQLAGKHDWVRGFNLLRNYGQHNSLLCGIRMAQNEIIVTMDDDLLQAMVHADVIASRDRIILTGWDRAYRENGWWWCPGCLEQLQSTL